MQFIDKNLKKSSEKFIKKEKKSKNNKQDEERFPLNISSPQGGSTSNQM